MADVKWIKIVTDIFDDEKIMLIESLPEADSIIVIWFKLLCLAGKQNNSGVFQINGRIPYTDEMFATIFRRKINTVRLALTTFEQYGMIEIINNTVTIPNWGKHQSIEQIEARREYQRNYQRQYYAKQKALAEGKKSKRLDKSLDDSLDKDLDKQNLNGIDKNRLDKNRLESNKALQSNGAVTEGNEDADNSRKRERFTPPTVSEVEAYAKEKGYTSKEFSPSGFVDFYQSKGWKVGKDRMKDWKAAARGWVTRYRQEHPAAPQFAQTEKPWWELPLEDQERLQEEWVAMERDKLMNKD